VAVLLTRTWRGWWQSGKSPAAKTDRRRCQETLKQHIEIGGETTAAMAEEETKRGVGGV